MGIVVPFITKRLSVDREDFDDTPYYGHYYDEPRTPVELAKEIHKCLTADDGSVYEFSSQQCNYAEVRIKNPVKNVLTSFRIEGIGAPQIQRMLLDMMG